MTENRVIYKTKINCIFKTVKNIENPFFFSSKMPIQIMTMYVSIFNIMLTSFALNIFLLLYSLLYFPKENGNRSAGSRKTANANVPNDSSNLTVLVPQRDRTFSRISVVRMQVETIKGINYSEGLTSTWNALMV